MNKDQNLMNRIRLGDEDAFSLLVEDLLSAAYKTAYLILHSKDLAEDAVQNALEDSYISIMKNKEIRNFKAWFYRLVYSRSIDLYRKNARAYYSDIDENPEAEAKMNSKSAQQQAIQNENAAEMISLIMTLDREQSVPILLYYYEDLSLKEISLILNENLNTVKTRVNRGRKKLAELMKKHKKYPMEANTYGI
ncbi:RNA polymerase sigma factor [Bacillus sp. UNC438CL73TsuS30]|uniref:RNA polymerase sigma factor n=1 Tax=Bacillus sp. UNC438CL73TsuS30 TaxID=1340434 RepID=UPI00047EB3CF|nr:RNA polymerase sigma factor [Bacillus sp. UNC438CL73TsuS30]